MEAEVEIIIFFPPSSPPLACGCPITKVRAPIRGDDRLSVHIFRRFFLVEKIVCRIVKILLELLVCISL